MLTPHRADNETFTRELAEAIERGKCSRCGTPYSFATAFVSVHSTEFGDLCVGEGRCVQFDIPYCDACEPEPEPSGCIHANLFTGQNARCDFCLQRSPLLAEYQVLRIGLVPSLANVWSACAECSKLIDAKQWPEFIGRCVDSIVGIQFPPGAPVSADERDQLARLVRTRVERMVGLVFKGGVQ